MENYEKKPLMRISLRSDLTDEQLSEFLQDRVGGVDFIINVLIEVNRRKDIQIANLTKKIEQLEKDHNRRIVRLEEKALKKPGRPKQSFTAPAFGCSHELTDEDLCELIDRGYYNSIGQMERELGAHKNQLRNRINKARKKRQLKWEVEDYGNC